MSTDWRQRARSEIRGVKEFWSRRYGWSPEIRNAGPETIDRPIDLYVRFSRKDRVFVLRLRYQEDFETAGRREAFVDPEDWRLTGPQFWPHDVAAVKATHNPPSICLEGTWGFHSVLHKERDGRVANL